MGHAGRAALTIPSKNATLMRVTPVTDDSTETKPCEDEKPKRKLVYRYEEVVRIAKLDPGVLESWEQEYPFLNAGRTGKGEKFFRQKDLDIILRIKELVASKTLTSAGIKRRIEEEFGLAPTTPVHPEKLRKALYNLRDELQELASSLARRPKKK